MNTKAEMEKDFLRLQKILRELRFLRYNYLNKPDHRSKIEEAIRLLGPMSDELKLQLDKITRKVHDYDV